MQRYDEFYDRPARYHPPARTQRRYRGATRGYRNPEAAELLARYADEYSFYYDDFGEHRPMGATPASQERMGMRDFSEHYGRYSGGSPYSYEYSERTIDHPHRFPGPIGFSRPLGEERFGRWRRRPRYGRSF
jgi:hypothetical protein